MMLIAGVAAGQSQHAAARAEFEVATVKPNNSGTGLIGGACHGTDSTFSGALAARLSPPSLGRCVYRRVTLRMLIQAAYSLTMANADELISGGPGWMGSDEFDLEAKAAEPATQSQMYAMLQTLLADRFRLRLHRETKEGVGFRLVVAKNGPKITPTPVNGERKGLQRFGGGPLTARGASMEQLAKTLSMTLAQPVVDETELAGAYDFTLTWTPGDGDVNVFGSLPPEVRARLSQQPAPSGPSLFTAVQEQLGLRLEARKVPRDVLVIDSAEKPGEN